MTWNERPRYQPRPATPAPPARPNPRAADAAFRAAQTPAARAASSAPSEPKASGSPLDPEDAAFLDAAALSPREWEAQELARVGYLPDVMADVQWRMSHDTPPPRSAIEAQPGTSLRPIPRRLQGAALGRELVAADLEKLTRRG